MIVSIQNSDMLKMCILQIVYTLTLFLFYSGCVMSGIEPLSSTSQSDDDSLCNSKYMYIHIPYIFPSVQAYLYSSRWKFVLKIQVPCSYMAMTTVNR